MKSRHTTVSTSDSFIHVNVLDTHRLRSPQSSDDLSLLGSPVVLQIEYSVRNIRVEDAGSLSAQNITKIGF